MRKMFLKICQQTVLNISKLLYDEIFSGHVIRVRTPKQQQNCFSSLELSIAESN